MGDVGKTRNKVKTTTSKLLALFMAAVLVCSTLGSVAAVADTQGTASGSNDATDCDISGYDPTSSLDESDKSDSTQKNVQATTSVSSNTFTEALYQSAEWTSKATGEAAINIHYEADLSKVNADETRSLYVFTNCTAHEFKITDAVDNILFLLESNDYVDVIMIVTNHTADLPGAEVMGGEYGQFTFAFEFSVSAEEFEELPGEDEEGLAQDAQTKQSVLTNIFTATSTEHFTTNTSAAQYAHALAAGGDSYKNTQGNIDVLYGDVTDAVLNFFTPDSYGQHAGVYFSLYYIDKYLGAINTRGLDLETSVKYIVNSFDGFATAYRNTYGDYDVTALYGYMESFLGFNPDSFTVAEIETILQSKFGNTLETLVSYDENGRYIALLADETADVTGYSVNSSWVSGIASTSTATYESLTRELCYTMLLIEPSNVLGSMSPTYRDLFHYDALGSSEGITFTLGGNGTYSLDAYKYSEGIRDLDILNISPDKSFLITATITSEFELITDSGGDADITVSNLSGTGTSFDYEISTSGGNGSATVVTITITNLAATDDEGGDNLYSDANLEGVSEWTIDVSIPVKLVAGTMSFRDTTDGADAFKETNAANTSAVVYSTNEGTGGGQDYVYERVTVASPKLYRSAGSLTVFKTVEDTSGTTEFDFEVTLPSVSGTLYYYTGTYNENTTTYGTITFTGGEITAVDDDPDTTTISLKHDESFTIVGLLTDVAYTVTESEASGYYAKSITVTDSGSQSVSGSSVDTAERTATTSIPAADETVTVTYTNTNTFDLVIWKYTGDDTSLGGATFSVAATGSTTKTGTTVSGTGLTTISDLSVDTVYEVTETQAVSGYNILSGSFYIKVGTDGKLYLGDSSDSLASTSTTTAVSGAVSIGSSTGTFQVNVLNTLNTTSALLPTTGGSGTLLFSVAGVALIALAAYALYRQRRGSMYAHAAHAVSNAVASPYQARAASRPQPTRRRTH